METVVKSAKIFWFETYCTFYFLLVLNYKKKYLVRYNLFLIKLWTFILDV